MKMSWKSQGRTITPGVYGVKVLEWEAGTSRNNNPTIAFTYEVVSPENHPDIGKPIWDIFTLTDKAAWRLAWFVSACGIKVENLPEMETGSEEFRSVLNACVDRVLYVSLVIDTFEGKERNKVTDYAKDEGQSPIENVDDVLDVPDFIKKKNK